MGVKPATAAAINALIEAAQKKGDSDRLGEDCLDGEVELQVARINLEDAIEEDVYEAYSEGRRGS